jgi:hypothetical protein
VNLSVNVLLGTVDSFVSTLLSKPKCVVNAAFDWRGLKSTKSDVVESVRNDWTNQDQVVRLGRLIERRSPDFGHAGLTGFTPVSGWVHSVASSSLACSSCRNPSDAPVHDFDSSGLGHSDSFLGRLGRCRRTARRIERTASTGTLLVLRSP